MRGPRYYSAGVTVLDSAPDSQPVVAHAASKTLAKRIANALNLYRPKVRTRKRAEKQQLNSRP